MDRFSIILGKEPGFSSGNEIKAHFSEKDEITIRKFKKSDSEMFFITAPGLTQNELVELDKALRPILGPSMLVTNFDYKIRKVNMSDVVKASVVTLEVDKMILDKEQRATLEREVTRRAGINE